MRDCSIIKALKPERWKERGCKACLTCVPSPFLHSPLFLFFSKRQRKGREDSTKEKERRQRNTERNEHKAKPSCCEFCHLLKKKKKKNLHLLALLGGLRRADALQWSMGLTVEDITMSLIETFLQGLLWGSCSVKPPSNACSSWLGTLVPGCGCYGGSWLAFTSPVSLLKHTHITLNKETTNNAEQFSASCTFK